MQHLSFSVNSLLGIKFEKQVYSRAKMVKASCCRSSPSLHDPTHAATERTVCSTSVFKLKSVNSLLEI